MMGGSKPAEVTQEIRDAVEKVLPKVQEKAAHVTALEVTEAMTQVVAGMNIFAKVKVNGSDEFLFLRIYCGLGGAEPELAAVQLSKTAADAICYFEAA